MTGQDGNGGNGESSDLIEAFTDGACSGNPGPGGWGAILRWRGHEKELSGGERETTNNRMELMAAIRVLETIKGGNRRVKIVTDSNYLRQGITQWIHAWRRKGWKTADNKPVKNKDLWQRLEAALKTHKVEWAWTKGHAGHPENERADALAREALKQYK